MINRIRAKKNLDLEISELGRKAELLLLLTSSAWEFLSTEGGDLWKISHCGQLELGIYAPPSGTRFWCLDRTNNELDFEAH